MGGAAPALRSVKSSPLTLASLWCTSPPRELREKIQPEILELIKQQRLNRLCEGSSFRKIGNRRRQGKGSWAPEPLPGQGACLGGPCRGQAGNKPASALCMPSPAQNCLFAQLLGFPCVAERFWYCRLALNHKVLHYGDLDDNPQGEVTFESLQEKSRFISLLMCPGS